MHHESCSQERGYLRVVPDGYKVAGSSPCVAAEQRGSHDPGWEDETLSLGGGSGMRDARASTRSWQ